AANIPPDADLIVIGKNAKLVRATNEEVRAAEDSGGTRHDRFRIEAIPADRLLDIMSRHARA
ncbi:MAG: hypothetical protein J0I19_05950, partial [Alphaproteobacteria bacterium]|nr:hypothetical protein [Alphaproteobacteria bacterium]